MPSSGQRVSMADANHAIIEMGTLRTTVAKERLCNSLDPELSLLLDLTEKNRQDLLAKGSTVVTDFRGHKQTVTVTWCNCSDMFAHRR